MDIEFNEIPGLSLSNTKSASSGHLFQECLNKNIKNDDDLRAFQAKPLLFLTAVFQFDEKFDNIRIISSVL